MAALTVVVLDPLGPPAVVISGRTEGAGILGRATAAAAGQTVYPGEEVLFEPSEQLHHQKVFYSEFTFYKEQSKLLSSSDYIVSRVWYLCPISFEKPSTEITQTKWH